MQTQVDVTSVSGCMALYAAADKAGRVAAARLEVRPMTVLGQGGEQWFVGDGVCGFAWVIIKPGNCRFAKFMKQEHDCRAAYGGGVQLWISDYNQSMQKKAAYARGFAEVLQEAGIRAYSGSRMD